MTKINEATTSDMARMLHNAVFAIPDKPVSQMSKVEYGELRRGELARELLFWLAGRTGDMETFIAFPVKKIEESNKATKVGLCAACDGWHEEAEGRGYGAAEGRRC